MDALAGQPQRQPAAPTVGRGVIRIGLSGWNYPNWRHRFYAGQHPRRWLEHCARSFTGVEVNATFFRFMKSDIVESWRDAVPPAFAFTVKGHRFVTHGQRLVGSSPLIVRQRDSLAPLGGRIAVALWQLPQNLGKDLNLLTGFLDDLAACWPEVRHAVEFRNDEWFDAETAALLASRNVAVCQSLDADWPCWPAVTTDFAYVRIYPGPAGCDLDALSEQISAWSDKGIDVHVYFDGDPAGTAPYQAMDLIEKLEPLGS